MRTGEQLAISAIKKEYSRLCKIAEKAKLELDEYFNAGTAMIDLSRELTAIVSSKEVGAPLVKKLEALQKRRDRLLRIASKDIIALSDRQIKADIERDNLLRHLQFRERSESIRKRNDHIF